MSDDDDILAGEHALGLADAGERALRDPDFAIAVDAWQTRLEPLYGSERAPPATVWAGVLTRLPANDPGVRDTARPWRLATMAASAVAAMLLGVMVLRPDAEAPVAAPTPQVAQAAPSKMMVAALTEKGGAGVLTVAYDAQDGRMTVTPVGMDKDRRAHELWVIPADGTPRSLGVIGAEPARMTVAQERRALLTGGATLAVSVEPDGGSPTGAPTGPVVMTGTMSIV